MSFSSEIKEELCGIVPSDRTSCLAELAGIYGIWGEGIFDGLRTDNEKVQKIFFTLLKKAYTIKRCELEGSGDGMRSCRAEVGGLLRMRELTETERARRAFVRGAFLAGGSLSDPEKYYHLEVVCPEETVAVRVQEELARLSLPARIVKRKASFVVYMKEAEEIAYALGIMGAGQGFMKLENARILREMRGNVNRQVNCETANLQKTALTSLRQREDVEYIRDHGGLGSLAPRLRMMAEVRLAHPEATLLELGRMMDPPIGKSGVNHRLARLHEIAERQRHKEGIM